MKFNFQISEITNTNVIDMKFRNYDNFIMVSARRFAYLFFMDPLAIYVIVM